MTQSANGVPVVEIANPNNQGLSHNRFTEFNVNKPGVIFNNSMRDGVSQIGEQVQRNAALTREAKAILTEVTGNGPSNISGTLEVFGGRADVLIANPNGVTLNGVNTYNTSGLTVSTGRVNPNTLQFTVDDTSGRVVIGADGVNTENLSFFDIVARGVDLNGEVGSASRSTDINVVTGLNTYNAQNHSTQKNTDSGKNTPQVAIAGNAAGAMHGRSITLISTETGAGVRQDGLIRAAQDINVSAAGDITLAAVKAGNNVAVTGTSAITLGDGKTGNGTEAGGRLALKTAGDIAINNDVQTDRFTADAKKLQINASTLNASGSTQDGTAKAITLNVDDFVLMGDLTLYAGVSEFLAPEPLITKEGKLQLKQSNGKYSDAFTLKSTAKLVSGGGIDITAKNFTNKEGIIQDTSTRGITITADHILNQGLVQTKGDLSLTATALDNLCATGASLGATSQTLCGGFFAAGNGDIKASLMNSEGGIVAGKALTLELGEGTHSIGAFGGVSAGQDLQIKAADGKKASLNIAGEMTAGRDLSVRLDALTAASGTAIKATRNASLNLDKTLTTGGEIRAGAALTISANDMRSTGTSKLLTGGNTTIAVTNQLVNEEGSTMTSLGDFSMKSGGDMSTAATINVAGDNALIHAEGELVNAKGSILTTKNLDMKSGGALTNENAALIYADNQLTLESGGDMINRQDSQLGSGDKLIAKVGGNLINSKGSFFEGQNVSIQAKNLVNSDDSTIGGYQTLNITTRGDVNNSGSSAIRGGTITVAAGGALNNDNSAIKANTVQLSGQTVTNSNKAEITGKRVSVTASDTLNTLTDSMIKGDNVAIDATYVKGSASSILAKDNLDVTTRSLQSSATIHSKNTATLNSKKDEDLAIGAGFTSPTADNRLTINTRDLTVDGSLKNASDLVINASGNVFNNGEIIGGSNLTVNAGQSIYNQANKLIYAAKNAVLNAGVIVSNNTNALIRANQNLTLSAKTAVINNVGRIDAGGDVAIDTPRLENLSDAPGDVTQKVIGDDKGFVHTDNWYSEAWGTWDTEYFHTEFWTPRYTGETLKVQQGVIKAGGNMLLNQLDHKGAPASVRNVGGLIAAGGDVKVDGDLTNIGVAKTISLVDYLKASSALAQWSVSESTKSDGPELRINLYDLLDKNLLAPAYVMTLPDRALQARQGYFEAPNRPDQVIQGSDKWMYSLRLSATPEVNTLFSAVFGADWKNLDVRAMRARWVAFKAAPDKTMDFYADKQAEVSAGGDFVQTGGMLTNGSNASWGKNRTVDVQIGDEKLVTVDGDLDALFNRDSAFDLSQDIDLKALRDAINSAKMQQDLMNNNPLFSANPPAPDLRQVSVDGGVTSVAGTEYKGTYPLYTSRVSFDPKDYFGSDYLFKKLGYNPEKTVTVLGDAYFDNELIVRTVERTVGNFFAVNNRWSGSSLVQNLMDNATTQATKLGLVVGQPLTAEQYEQLDRDIVWYEPQMVNGVSVLAPKVYISKNTLQARQLDQKSGGLITAKNVSIDATSVNNINGVIRSTNNTLVNANGDINNVAQGGTDTGIYSGLQGRLVTAAGGNVLNQGGNLQGFDQTVSAGKSVTSVAATGYDEKGSLKVRDNGKLGAGMTESGKASTVTVVSGGDINLTGAQTAADKVSLQAKGSLNMQDINEVASSFESSHKSGVLSYQDTRITKASTTSKGNQVDAKDLTISSGGDWNVKGSNVNATTSDVNVAGNTTVAAGKDAAYYQKTQKTFQFVAGASAGSNGHETEDSFGVYDTQTAASNATASDFNDQNIHQNGGAVDGANKNRGDTVGTRARYGFELSQTEETKQDTTHRNAQLNLGSGNLNVGGTFDLGGADINAGSQQAQAASAMPTLAIKAGDIKSTKFQDSQKQSFSREETFFGLENETHSSIANVATNINKTIDKKAEGMEVDGALTAAAQAGNITQVIFGDTFGASTTYGLKHTKTSSESQSKAETINRVGGNISLTTTQGDINLKGVDIKGGNVALDSAGGINQKAAEASGSAKSNTEIHTSGFTIAVSAGPMGAGMGASLGASGNYDNGKASSSSFANSTISGDQVSIKAKGDHTMEGAAIKANKLDYSIDGTQTIRGVQDASNMDHERGSWSASAGVALSQFGIIPTASSTASGGKDYDNSKLTAEQSGIQAGTLNLKVGGDQNLSGAHIINTSGNGTYRVDGTATVTDQQDSRDKDGGYGGGGGGISKSGVPNVVVETGRVDQVKYDATQKSTVDLGGGKMDVGGGVKGNLNTNGKQLVAVSQNSKVAGTDIKVELAMPAMKSNKKNAVGPAPEADAPSAPPARAEEMPTPGTSGARPQPVIETPATITRRDGDDAPSAPVSPSHIQADMSDAPARPASAQSDAGDGASAPRTSERETADAPAKAAPAMPDVETVTKPVKEEDQNARYMTQATVGKDLRNVLAKLNSQNKADQADLKANPMKVNVRNADGTVTTHMVSDANSLKALNGVKVVTGSRAELVNFAKGMGANSDLYIKVVPQPGGGFTTTFTPTKPAALR